MFIPTTRSPVRVAQKSQIDVWLATLRRQQTEMCAVRLSRLLSHTRTRRHACNAVTRNVLNQIFVTGRPDAALQVD